MDRLELKTKLLEKFQKDLKYHLSLYKKEMDAQQEEANYHKGAMESRYDTFKEEAQMLKDAYQKQYNEINQNLLELGNFIYNWKNNPKKDKVVKIGSLLKVYNENDDIEEWFFIFQNQLSYVKYDIDGELIQIVNPTAPLPKLMLRKEEGDEIEFNNNFYEILEIV